MSDSFTLPSTLHFVQRDWLSANALFGLDSDAITIVDTGYKKHAAQTLQLVQHQEALWRGQLQRIVNTHLHSDHCGGNTILQAHFPKVQTYIPDECADAVKQWNESALSFAATGQDCDPFNVTHSLKPNQVLSIGGFDWKTIRTEGHDHTMLALYCEELQLLLSADALWENGFGVTFPELDHESGFAQQEATLNQLSQLPVRWVLPGHGRAFNDFTGAIERAQSKLRYFRSEPERHEWYALKVLIKFILLDRGQLSIDEIAQLTPRSRLLSKLSENALNAHAANDQTSALTTLLQKAGTELVATKAARWEGELLINC